jgi:hypothetical protein
MAPRPISIVLAVEIETARGGRPKIPPEIRRLIQDMSLANSLCDAPLAVHQTLVNERRGSVVVNGDASIKRVRLHLQVLDDGTKDVGREVDQAAGDDDDAQQQRHEQAVVSRESACRGRNQLL